MNPAGINSHSKERFGHCDFLIEVNPWSEGVDVHEDVLATGETCSLRLACQPLLTASDEVRRRGLRRYGGQPPREIRAEVGDPGGYRTRGPLIKSQMLYH